MYIGCAPCRYYAGPHSSFLDTVNLRKRAGEPRTRVRQDVFHAMDGSASFSQLTESDRDWELPKVETKSFLATILRRMTGGLAE